MDSQRYFNLTTEFKLESGKVLQELTIAYHTFGSVNDSRDNVIWVFHNLSANSNVLSWWPGLFGSDRIYDPKDYFIICVNAIGSPYGSSAPQDLNFPQFSIRDIVQTQLMLADHLDIKDIYTVIGASFGGNQALEFAYSYTGTIRNLVLIASSSKESAWAIAAHESQRMALETDPSFGQRNGGQKGMRAARSMAMLTYRTADSFIKRQTDEEDKLDDFAASSYLQYQGDKFVKRFDALSYYYLSKALDSHNIGRGRGGEQIALSKIKAKTLIIGISSDILIPTRFQKFMHAHIPNSIYREIKSEYGHDGFLIEFAQISTLLRQFYQSGNQQKISKWRILKFGGTSLATGIGLSQSLDIIKHESARHPIALVVSARGRSTDYLAKLYSAAVDGIFDQASFEAFFLCQELDEYSIDYYTAKADLKALLDALILLKVKSIHVEAKIMAFGELLSALAISALLISEGISAQFVDARSYMKGSIVEGEFKVNEAISSSNFKKLFAELGSNVVPVITGFIASDSHGNPHTLGRNGSNYTASLIASFIQAERIENWTDIDGLYSADPNLVENAQKIDAISYKEANELANFGVNLLHARTLVPLMEHDIPLHIKNTFYPNNKGTTITKSGSENKIKAISCIKNVAMISIEGKGLNGKVGIDARIFNKLSEKNISIRLISQASSERGIGFVVDKADARQAEMLLFNEFEQEMRKEEISNISVNNEVSIIAIVGRHNYALEKAIAGLRRNRIWMYLISNSISGEHISLVVDNSKLKKAMNIVHKYVFGGKKEINVFAFGKGVVGKEFIKQVLQTSPELERQRGININIIGLADSKYAIIQPNGIQEDWSKHLFESSKTCDPIVISRQLRKLNLENVVIVDNTGSSDLISHYPLFIKSGFDLVAANKKANSGALSNYHRIRELLRKNDTHFLYETNVGAGLPIVDTIKYLRKSADRIKKIKGVFSGSLSYIFNQFSKNDVSFIDCIIQAQELGLTEPDPRDDLSGLDVARKLIILAREAGFEVNLADVRIENLIPSSVQNELTYEGFLNKMDEVNLHYEQVKENLNANQVLRYIGEFNEVNKVLTVKLTPCDKSSPLGNLQDSDVLIEIYTQAYGEKPIIVQGAGAGAVVTARGVYSDVLRIGEMRN